MSNIDQALDTYINGAGAKAAAANASPERAAQALRLSEATAVPAQAIINDPTNAGEALKERIRRSLVEGSPALQQYVNTVPLAAQVSADDFERLQAVAEATDVWKSLPRDGRSFNVEPGRPTGGAGTRVPTSDWVELALRRAGEGFSSVWNGPGLIDEWEKEMQRAGIYGDGPLRFMNRALLNPIVAGVDLSARLFSATTAAVGQGLGSLAESANIVPHGEAERLGQEITTFLDIAGLVAGSEISPRPPRVEAIRTPGPDKQWYTPDDIVRYERALPELEVAMVDELHKIVQETATRKRAPAEMTEFLKQQVGNERIGLNPEAVVKLYEEKGEVPQAGDGVLGVAEPAIAQKLDRALATGGDVEVRLDRYLANVEKDVHEALLTDLRVRQGETISERKLAAEAADSKMKEEQLPHQAEADIENGPVRSPIQSDIPTDHPVAAAAEPMRKELFLEPLIEPKAAGMPKPLYKAFSDRLEEYVAELNVSRVAVAELEARIRATEEWKTILAEERARAEAEFDARLDISAEVVLRETKIKLATDEPVPRGLTARDGVDADEIAGALGYANGEALIRDLVALERDRARQSPGQYRENFVRQRAETATELRLGETDRVVAEKALEAVTSEPMQQLLHEDLKALRAQDEGLPAPIGLEEVRLLAQRLFDKEPLANAKRLDAYLRNVARAGRVAELALAKGQILKAFQAKQQQLIATLVAREAMRFQKELVKARKLIDRFANRETVSGVPQEYTDQIQRLLVQFGVPLRKRDLRNLVDAIVADGRTLEEFVREKIDVEGYDMAVAAWIYDPILHIPLNELTVQQFGEFVDSIRSMAHVGGEEKTLRREGKAIELEIARSEIVANLETLPPRSPGGRGIREAAKHIVYSVDAMLAKLEYIFDELDIRSPDGPWNQYVVKPLTEAKFKEDDLFVRVGEELSALPKIENARRYVENDFEHPMRPGKTYELRRADVVMMGFNAGNKRNREILVKTLVPDVATIENLADPRYLAAERRVMGFIEQTLTKNDWDYVQGLWDFFARLKPEIDALYRRTTGVAPDSVPPSPIRTLHGTYTGGYAPIIHDSLASADKIKSEKASFDYNYHRATTPNRYTVKRTKAYDPMQIEGYDDQLWLRVREMLHDIAFREAVGQTRKVITDRQIREAFNKFYGPEYADMLHPWLKDIANRFNVEDRAFKWLSGFLRGTRKNLVIATLGFNLKTILTPQIGPLLVDAAVSPVETARIMADLPRYWNFVMERSGELRHRIENYDRDIRAGLQDSLGVTTPLAKVQRNAARFSMYPAVMIDTTLAMITWLGHYRKAMRAGAAEGEAIFGADKAVRNYFGAAGRTDLAMIMRGGEAQKTLLTLFYGYMNGAYNGTRDAVQFTRSGARLLRQGDYAGARRDFAHAWGQTVRWFLAPAILGAVYSPDLLDGIDDFAGFIKGLFRLGAAQLSGTVPGVREVASTVIQGFPSRGSPAVEIAKKAITGVPKALEAEGDQWLRHAIAVPGYVFGVPTNQAAISAQFLWNLGHNIDHAKGFDDFVQGLIYGETENKRKRR